ncbi:MAG TPA: 2-hydroxyglutaryl-CoA dehydratase, partial [Bacteroides sp.]|nr:2-hydroxyglutaryl-CoA dehydratase [Bacteroides sp.]
DNICFPAKLVHSHIANLQAQKVDRIFMPFVLFEPSHANEQNSFNCPIVTGYSAVVKSVQPSSIPLDSPVIGFKDEKLLLKQCTNYLVSLGVDSKVVADAFRKAVAEQQRFHEELTAYNRHLLEAARQQEKLCILLAGRPYHTDPLIQ